MAMGGMGGLLVIFEISELLIFLYNIPISIIFAVLKKHDCEVAKNDSIFCRLFLCCFYRFCLYLMRINQYNSKLMKI